MNGDGRLFGRLALDRRLVRVLTVVFAGVAVSTLVVYFSTKDTVEGLAMSQTHQTLGFFDRELGWRVREMTARLQLWSGEDIYQLALEDSYLGMSAREEATRRMAARVQGSAFDRVFLIKSDGEIPVASNPDMEGRFSVGDRAYFQRAMAGETAMETLAAGRHSNLPMLVIAAPVRNKAGDVVGVLAVAMETARFGTDMLGIRSAKTGVGYILDRNGQVLSAPSGMALDHARIVRRLDVIRRSVERDGPMLFREGEDQRVLLAKANAATGWYLVLEADEAEVLRPAARIAWMTGGVSLATLALVALALAALGRAMSGLRQSEEKFSKLFQVSPDTILLVDMETSRIVDVNETFTHRTGYTREEAVGGTSAELSIYVRLEDRERFYQRLHADGRVENLEIEARYKDGRIAICALSGRMVTIGNRRYLMNIVRDITELKKMQEMMIQTEKMISVGGIAAGIAHEINNPLGIVLQAAQNLAQRTKPDFRKNVEAAEKIGLDMGLVHEYMKVRKLDVFIEDIQSAAARASAIIRHMLDFSRRSESRRTVCDPRAIADSAVELAENDYDLKKSYDFKKIEIVRDYAADLPGIGCTATEIEQVLLNVLRNAAQAMATAAPPPAAPRIAIRIRNLPDRARIEIADNGPGIPEAARRRIFEPFYTTKPPGVGTGLGLSVSYFIVTKGHGGRMTVEAGPEGGAMFVIDLPKEGELELT
ncbi:sensor histidine kinase [Desulfolutivibrio sulfoxidireducens]|uniref:sensor histidine kinase n=1 Tax=Desulfolutivibrio sulfoxidireducens TaxID=2773299 RepID=UPI00210E049E|nr:PAS domain-containing sensor histidine kinase [Desulfolutivibrio sulfoxidireducens]